MAGTLRRASPRPIMRRTGAKRARSAAAARPTLDDLLAAGSRKGSILLVEDDEDLRTLMERALKQAGYRTHVAGDGAQCLRLARTLRPDLILLNYLMPVMDGLTALRRLKRDPVISYLRVLMYSGVSRFMEFRDAALKAGAAECLQSPVRLPALLRAVERNLGS